MSSPVTAPNVTMEETLAKVIAGLALYVMMVGVAHAESPVPDEDTQAVADATGLPVVDVMGAAATVGVPARTYLEHEGLLKAPAPRHPWLREFMAIHLCEAPGGWATNTGNGYFGGLQEDMQFWATYGGYAYAPRPDQATMDEQITVAERAVPTRGFTPWPVCGLPYR